MEDLDLTTATSLAIRLIYTILFGTAAWDKIKGKVTPEWFLKSFEPTFISKLPGGARSAFWLITGAETLLAIAFPLSLIFPILLPYALLSSMFLFAGLCFGLRITGDFQGSANVFIYFAASILSLSILQ